MEGKAGAVDELLDGIEIDTVVFAGDDRTDLEAALRLRKLAEEGQLKNLMIVAIDSSAAAGNATVLFPNTTAAGSNLAEKVLEATINIPPLLYQNQGSIVGVYVARDVDFSKVYALEPR